MLSVCSFVNTARTESRDELGVRAVGQSRWGKALVQTQPLSPHTGFGALEWFSSYGTQGISRTTLQDIKENIFFIVTSYPGAAIRKREGLNIFGDCSQWQNLRKSRNLSVALVWESPHAVAVVCTVNVSI